MSTQMSVVITVEGVLRKNTDGQEIPLGVDWVRTLASLRDGLRIFLTERDPADTEVWLAAKGITFDLVVRKTGDRLTQMRDLLFHWGYVVDYCVEPDPAIVVQLLREGYTVLGFFHPYYAKPEWRPDYDETVRPWDDLVRQAREDSTRHANDGRIRRTE